MLESTQQIRKIDLDYYVINYQWFRVAYIILCNLQEKNSQILPTRTNLGNPLTDDKQKKKKKEEKKSKHFCKDFPWNVVGFPSVSIIWENFGV